MTEELEKQAYEEIDKNLELLARFYNCTTDDIQRDLLLDATREEIKGIHSELTFDDMVGRRRINAMAPATRALLIAWIMLGVIGMFSLAFKVIEYIIPLATAK